MKCSLQLCFSGIWCSHDVVIVDFEAEHPGLGRRALRDCAETNATQDASVRIDRVVHDVLRECEGDPLVESDLVSAGIPSNKDLPDSGLSIAEHLQT